MPGEPQPSFMMHDIVSRPRDAAPYPAGDRELELSLSDIVAFLWGYRLLISLCVAIAAMLAVLYVITATPIFTAKVQVLIESRLPQNFREYASESIATLDTPAVESQVAIILSEKIAEKVVKKAGFLSEPPKERTGFSFNPVNVIRSLLASRHIPAPESEDEQGGQIRAAMERLWGGMTVNRLGLSHVIEISYSSPNRDQAAEVTNAIADAYIEDQLETRAESARQGSIWLEARIDSLRRQMNEAALRVKEFKARRDYRVPTSAGQANPPSSGPDPAADDAPVATTVEDLESQASTYRKIYESYLQAYTESVQTQSYPVTNTRIITRATRPSARSWPRSTKVMVIAIALGGMAGIGLTLLHYSFTRSRHLRRARPGTRPS
jgi:uncharacterized protein involved in exopolysaccharide biosynthesis